MADAARIGVFLAASPANLGVLLESTMTIQPSVDVFVLGPPSESSEDMDGVNWPVAPKVIRTGVGKLADFAGTPWAERLAEGEGELVALACDDRIESIRAAAVLALFMANGPDVAARLMIDPVDSWKESIDLTKYPSVGINVLLAPRAAHGPIVFRRNKLKEIGGLRPVIEPVWDWLIRVARKGERIGSTEIDLDLRSTTCRLPLLAPSRPGKESDWLLGHLHDFSPKEFGMVPDSAVSETALRAGLFLWHDYLDESHRLSQSIEGEGEDQLGDYWHALMHRREPDYSNAKYWFRQIGQQQTFRSLRKFADETLANLEDPGAGRWRDRLQPGAKWDPFAFVDLCEECAADEESELALAARRIQYFEMSLLMRMTASRMRGGDSASSIALAAKRA
ncbi:MAG: hypothetical protein HY290_08725 [Planctomycetia bacterium]|nr:hypothetical protein [Planctomycetia bacterium]